MKIRKEYSGMLCAIGASIGFGCGSTALKVIYRTFGEIPFQDLSLLRSVFCLAAFLIFAVRENPAQLRVNRKELGFFAFAGICGLFVVQFFLLLALQMIPVGVCSFTQSSSTIMVCLCSVLIFHEKISRSKLTGIGCGLCGLALVVWQRVDTQIGEIFVLGVLCAFASGVGKTVYLLCGKSTAKNGRRSAMMTYGMLACTMMGIPFASSPARVAGYFMDAKACVFLLLYMLFCSVLPYILTFRAIELLPASTVGSLNVVEPVAGAVSAFLVLREPLSARQMLGAAFIMMSVFLIHHDVRRAAGSDNEKLKLEDGENV